jgi:serine/threonine protein kinase
MRLLLGRQILSPRQAALGIMKILRHEDGPLFELGRGAMGITYKASDVDLRRFAALKVISPRYLADEAARSRFLREARAAGSVRHPNVASVTTLALVIPGLSGHLYSSPIRQG